MGGGGYKASDAPWRFQGRALYQLNLVRASEARKHVPADLKLVELFGYTLGGVYLARYEDSPAGTFDEMVALGGLVWNAPTSCAWAARVFVSDAGARAHGVKTCGLPSAFATFAEKPPPEAEKPPAEASAPPAVATTAGWWKNTSPPSRVARVRDFFVAGGWRDALTRKRAEAKRSTSRSTPRAETLELRDESGAEVCSLAIPAAAPALSGPRIGMRLPSFSGRTAACPDLLKYSLDLRANVRLSEPIAVRAADEKEEEAPEASEASELGVESGMFARTGEVRFPPAAAARAAAARAAAASVTLAAVAAEAGDGPAPAAKQRPPRDEDLDAILRGKPLLCIAFDRMEMDVGAPAKVAAPP